MQMGPCPQTQTVCQTWSQALHSVHEEGDGEPEEIRPELAVNQQQVHPRPPSSRCRSHTATHSDTRVSLSLSLSLSLSRPLFLSVRRRLLRASSLVLSVRVYLCECTCVRVTHPFPLFPLAQGASCSTIRCTTTCFGAVSLGLVSGLPTKPTR